MAAAAHSAAVLVVVLDCVMTFFGSTANDAAFNAWVTDVTVPENRGRVETVLAIMPLVAMLVVFGALDGLTQAGSWRLFFLIVGGVTELGGVLVYLSVENLSAASLPVDTSYLQSRGLRTREQLYSMGTGVTAACNGQSVPCGSFAAPLYNENAADASVFTLNLAAGRGALLHCFCAVPEDWQTLALTWHPDFAAGRSAIFTVRRDADEAALGPVPTTPAEVGSVVDL